MAARVVSLGFFEEDIIQIPYKVRFIEVKSLSL